MKWAVEKKKKDSTTQQQDYVDMFFKQEKGNGTIKENQYHKINSSCLIHHRLLKAFQATS